jgi:hypothetical protein
LLSKLRFGYDAELKFLSAVLPSALTILTQKYARETDAKNTTFLHQGEAIAAGFAISEVATGWIDFNVSCAMQLGT